jgi:hypothetical protein
MPGIGSGRSPFIPLEVLPLIPALDDGLKPFISVDRPGAELLPKEEEESLENGLLELVPSLDPLEPVPSAVFLVDPTAPSDREGPPLNPGEPVLLRPTDPPKLLLLLPLLGPPKLELDPGLPL